MPMRRAWPVAVLMLLAVTGSARAADGCLFIEAGHTWTLDADCTVDGSLVIPDGVTLDGAQHTIIAVDPRNGAFRGGIIVAGGRSANVTNTTISALMLTNVCQDGNDRLRAIYFNGASGAIRGNTIVNVNKGASACQEGNGIEVRNIDLAGPPTSVEISDNVVDGFQKTGIVVSGNVDATIRGNSIGPSAAQRLIVANGVRVERNRLTDTGSDTEFDVGIGNYGHGNVFEGNIIRGFAQPYQNVPEPEGGNATVAAR